MGTTHLTAEPLPITPVASYKRTWLVNAQQSPVRYRPLRSALLLATTNAAIPQFQNSIIRLMKPVACWDVSYLGQQASLAYRFCPVSPRGAHENLNAVATAIKKAVISRPAAVSGRWLSHAQYPAGKEMSARTGIESATRRLEGLNLSLTNKGIPASRCPDSVHHFRLSGAYDPPNGPTPASHH